MSSQADRKAEIQRKKTKLQAMRDEKKRLEAEKSKKKAEGVVVESPAPAAPSLSTDQILADAGVDLSRADRASPAPVARLALGDPVGGPSISPSPHRKLQLGVSKVTQTNIPPKETVAYNKEVQTTIEGMNMAIGDASGRSWDYYALTYVDLDDENDSLDTPPAHHGHGHPKVNKVVPAITEDVLSPKEELPPPVPELTDQEKESIMVSDEFKKFLDRTTRVVERAMSENVDIFIDYTGADQDDDSKMHEGEKLKLNRTFSDERWSKHRTITCMDWSSQHPELLVASYNANEEAPNDPDGVALIWNLKYKKTTPEYIFHCQSPVMSTCFAKFHPNLVVGGTYSGQIVLWDNRSNKRTPVQRTPLSAAAHTHPVYCVNVVGTQNAHNLISVSTDGKMCSWSLDMLSQPQDSMELQHKQSKAVAVTSLSFLSGDVNNFVVGSEEGAVYTACRHGSKAGIADVFEGHQGPVTGINCHTVPGQIDFSPYFLTSSFDWTVKLWNIKENRPLHSFEDNGDYVYDACWSPVHPALFATCDGAGRLDMWNLNNDTEVPTASVTVEGNVALNRCRWHSTGTSIAAGDDLGKIHIYDVAEHLAQPKTDEWSRFVHTLQELKNQQAENDDDPTSLSLLSSSSPLR